MRWITRRSTVVAEESTDTFASTGLRDASIPLTAHTKPQIYKEENGGRTWARTKDPLIKSQLLYQLSYASMP